MFFLGFVPVIRRSELRMDAKLYRLATGEVIWKHSLKETTPWDRYLNGIFKIRRPFDRVRLIEEADLLVISISLKLMKMIQRSIERNR